LELPDELGHDVLAHGRAREHARWMRTSTGNHLGAEPPANGHRRPSSGEPERQSGRVDGARVPEKGRGSSD
jgi:hypothetical protein